MSSALPGFGPALGYTLLYLSLIVLIPLSAAFLKTFTLTWQQFRGATAGADATPGRPARFTVTVKTSFRYICTGSLDFSPSGNATVGAAGPAADAGEGTDFHAVAEGYVSVTPLQIDLTHDEQLPAVAGWLGTELGGAR